MKFHKIVSLIFHPVNMPTIGILLYLILVDIRININQKLTLIGIVFLATYLIPMLLLIVLKSLNLIHSYKASTIPERKFPIIIMIILFFFIGKSFNEITAIKDISILFYGTSLSLVIVYLLFSLKIKTSLHLISMGSALGFLILLEKIEGLSLKPVLMIFVIITGFVGTSRLYLKAHKPKEVYIGFFIGLISQFFAFEVLQ